MLCPGLGTAESEHLCEPKDKLLFFHPALQKEREKGLSIFAWMLI